MNKIVFPGRSESWLTYREIQSAYDRAFKKLGFPHRGTHVLRHTFAVRFLDRTKDIHSVKRILGHKNLKDTEVYANYSDESVRQSVALFNRGKSLDSEGFVSESVSD